MYWFIIVGKKEVYYRMYWFIIVGKKEVYYRMYWFIIADEIEIKESLLKALKMQQEKCVRVGSSSSTNHQNCARIMGHVYNMALSWNDK